jgi:hypothetical protein
MFRFEYHERRLIQCGIPKSPAVLFEIPATKKSLFVSFSLTRVIDLAVCGLPFWGVDFTYEIVNTKDTARVELQRWHQQGDST